MSDTQSQPPTAVHPHDVRFPSLRQHLICWTISAVGIILLEIASTAQTFVEHAVDPNKLDFLAKSSAQPDFLQVALHGVYPGVIIGVLVALKVAGVILIGPMMRLVSQFLGAGTLVGSRVLGRILGEFAGNFKAAPKPPDAP